MTSALWIPKRPMWLMVTATVVVCLISPYDLTFGDQGFPGLRQPAVPLVLGAAVVALQLRHSFAAARGARPRLWGWTLVAFALLTYLPMAWYTWQWLPVQGVLMASVLMLLRPEKLGLAVVCLSEFVMEVVFVAYDIVHDWPTLGRIYAMFLWGISLPMITALVWGAARMVRGADELRAARTDLAELAIAQERLRVSRDLHDLIGQSLSAVSLRGDLALRLLSRDPDAAQAEISMLTATARSALHDVLSATSAAPGADLSKETAGAVALLSAAGIKATVMVDVKGLRSAAQTVFAWTLREGVTNILRHSDAQECSITVTHPGAAVRLEIVNDGVGLTGNHGNGLTGLAERARAFSGVLTAGPLSDGRFRLLVEFPEERS